MDIDLDALSGSDIDEFARRTIAESGDPGGDWRALASALKNAQARERALEDPYWLDLVNLEADAWPGVDV